jgi:hypothetical protein
MGVGMYEEIDLCRPHNVCTRVSTDMFALVSHCCMYACKWVCVYVCMKRYVCVGLTLLYTHLYVKSVRAYKFMNSLFSRDYPLLILHLHTNTCICIYIYIYYTFTPYINSFCGFPIYTYTYLHTHVHTYLLSVPARCWSYVCKYVCIYVDPFRCSGRRRCFS